MRLLLTSILLVGAIQLLAQDHPVPAGHPSFQKEGSWYADNAYVETANSSPDKGRWPMVGGVNPIHILSWNIYMRPHSVTFDGQFRRAKAIGEVLKDENYDIILFQEAFGKTSRKRLRKALGGAFPYEIEPKNNGKTVNSGLWILSKHKIEGSDFIFFSDCKVSDCQSSKGAVLFAIEIRGQLYHFINTHVQAEDGKQFAMVRAKQFAMIDSLLIKKVPKNFPVFILGDLNTPFDSISDYQTMLQLLNASDGTVSVTEATELSTQNPITWGCKNNDLIKNKWKGHVQLLDYALQCETGYPFKLRRELRTYTKKWSRKHKHLSDHYAISLTILP